MAEEMLQTISKDEIERARFRSRRMFQMDLQDGLLTARGEGLAEGEAKGRAEGEAKGKIEIALKLKKAKALTNKEIAKFTGLSLSEVEELR